MDLAGTIRPETRLAYDLPTPLGNRPQQVLFYFGDIGLFMDAEQISRLASVVMEAERDLYALLARDAIAAIDSDDTSQVMAAFLAEKRARERAELNTAGWDAIDGEVA